MQSYLCANHHHFRAPRPACPMPGCTAEIRPTAVDPSTDGGKPSFKHLPRLNPEERRHPALEAAIAVLPPKHAIRWWVYVGSERIPATSSMKNKDYVWDATCAPCDWDSGTGGANAGIVRKLVQEHKR